MKENSLTRDPLDTPERIEAALMRQEHRAWPVLQNFLQRDRFPDGDPRRHAATFALAWKVFSLVTTTSAVGGLLTVGTLYFSARQTALLERQTNLMADQARLLGDQVRGSFEPRLVVSQFTGRGEERLDGPWKYISINTGNFWVKNVGAGEALDVECTLANPFNGTGEHFPFAKPLLNVCDGEPIALLGSNARSPRYNSMLAPGEERQLCITGLDLDMRGMDLFLVVLCGYSDKGGTRHTQEQKIAVANSSYSLSDAESSDRVRELVEKYSSDEAVLRNRHMWPKGPTPTQTAEVVATPS